MTDKIKEVVSNAALGTAIGIKRMFITIWCVTAEVAIVWMAINQTTTSSDGLVNTPLPEYIVIIGMTVIGLLGGVDVWKNGLLKK